MSMQSEWVREMIAIARAHIQAVRAIDPGATWPADRVHAAASQLFNDGGRPRCRNSHYGSWGVGVMEAVLTDEGQ